MIARRIVLASMVVTALAFGVAAQEQDFAKRGRPGPEHERLCAALAGKWSLTVEGQPGKGSAEFKPILGGRFVTEEAKLPFGDLSFEWVGIYGYDAQKKKYTAVWVDNMDTSTEMGEGDADPSGKTLNFRGDHLDPHTGKTAKFLWRITRDGEKSMIVEMFEEDASGKEQKVFEFRGEKVS